MHNEYPWTSFGTHFLPAAFALAMAIPIASASARSGSGASSTDPGAAVPSTQPATAAAHAGKSHAARGGNDIDRFMERVLARRAAAPWRRLSDFVLRETSTFELAAPAESRLLSPFRRIREYEWYVSEAERRCAAPCAWTASASTTRRGAATNGPGCARKSGGAPRY